MGNTTKQYLLKVDIAIKYPLGKQVVTDRVYGNSKNKNHNRKLCLPNPLDDKKTAKFKACIRCRHETFNGRLSFFNALNATFCHSHGNHQCVFQSVAVIVQYQMDLGAPLFDA